MKIRLACLSLAVCILFANCSSHSESAAEPKIKNVILMIGDGMGPMQVAQAVFYRRHIDTNSAKLALENLYTDGVVGQVDTTSYKSITTDSAAAATALACGKKTYSEMIGMTPDQKPCSSVLEEAHQLGKATGLVSNTRLSHATPAGFIAHNVARNNENEIADDIISRGVVDVLLDGGARHLLPQFAADGVTKMKFSQIPGCEKIDSSVDGTSKRLDQKNLIDLAKQNNYNFACTADQLKNFDPSSGKKLLGVFSNSYFPMYQERSQIPSVPSLAAMTDKALQTLSRNPKGFFVMIEGGLIDVAGHANDAGSILAETLDFDRSIAVAREFVKNHPDTLLIVTADHETGGFAFSPYQVLEKRLPEKNLPSQALPFEISDYTVDIKTVYDHLTGQKASWSGLLSPILAKLYPQNKNVPVEGYSMAQAVNELRDLVKEKVGFDLDDKQASFILEYDPKMVWHEPHGDFLYPNDNLADFIGNKLGRVVSPWNHAVWVSGSHTAVPVLVFAEGPKSITQKFAGLIDNTDIPKIIRETF